jgi:hypothetical protein
MGANYSLFYTYNSAKIANELDKQNYTRIEKHIDTIVDDAIKASDNDILLKIIASDIFINTIHIHKISKHLGQINYNIPENTFFKLVQKLIANAKKAFGSRDVPISTLESFIASVVAFVTAYKNNGYNVVCLLTDFEKLCRYSWDYEPFEKMIYTIIDIKKMDTQLLVALYNFKFKYNEIEIKQKILETSLEYNTDIISQIADSIVPNNDMSRMKSLIPLKDTYLTYKINIDVFKKLYVLYGLVVYDYDVRYGKIQSFEYHCKMGNLEIVDYILSDRPFANTIAKRYYDNASDEIKQLFNNHGLFLKADIIINPIVAKKEGCGKDVLDTSNSNDVPPGEIDVNNKLEGFSQDAMTNEGQMDKKLVHSIDI